MVQIRQRKGRQDGRAAASVSGSVGCALFFRAGSANNARNVNSDGTLNRNNAYNGNNGLRPASMDSPTY